MKLSVAMITYNQERFIGQAIESVLAQRVNFDYEIVIGEDCSTDGTRAVVMDKPVMSFTNSRAPGQET
jgi:glycosyltransferase involved in cell wall biosynthesis